MSEKKRHNITMKKAGAAKAAAKQRSRSALETGIKKLSARWFSTDSMIGKALCILLVIILTMGAFLAPKLINNLYDAGTLMQITYVDMDLSPYAVSYASFEDKLKAIARANTSGDHLVTLSAEEADEKISDAELAEIVNREMEAASESLSLLFYEGWWSQLGEENLVSRERNTIYVQQIRSAANEDSKQETAPIQFWMLTFEAADASVFEWEDMTDAERETVEQERAFMSGYATDRLTVCLDTDFYKIYAVGVEGYGDWIETLYGWDVEELFGLVPQSKGIGDRYRDTELGMFMTDQIVECWADYWNVTREDKNIYINNIEGEISGCMAFLENGDKGKENGTGAEETLGSQSSHSAAGDVIIVEGTGDMIYMGSGINENEILLEVGCRGSWDKAVEGRWIQKTGCRDFFDMMQF